MHSAEPFRFLDPGPLSDSELTLRLSGTADANPPQNTVPTYRFDLLIAGQVAGGVRFRPASTPDVELYAGHLGYGVAPAFRGRHLAERACRLLLPFAALHGFEALWITCDPDNQASRRTCERLGAVLVEIVDLPEDSDMYRDGERQKCRYRLSVPPAADGVTSL